MTGQSVFHRTMLTLLVLEAWLCAQQGNDGVLKCPGKFCNTMGLQLNTHRTSIHVSLLGSED